MISIENLGVSFGAKPLFSGASLIINDHDRIALTGKNGAGKSTLLKILCGEQQPTTGSVGKPQDCHIGYLPQVMNLSDDTTVIDEARKAFKHITEMAEKLKQLEKQMSERTDYESDSYMALVEKYTVMHDTYQMAEADSNEARLERTLTGLGFRRDDFLRPTSEFSGGWRMRIELAKILLENPDVLLLDEPTNHLDIESIQWLENFLAQSSKAVVLVSHDRAFINRVCNRTWEISCGKIIDYKTGYDEYVKLRQERREQQLRAYENQQKLIQETKDFIEKFRYKPTKAVQVQSRIKMLEKIVPIEVDEVDNSALHLKFPPSQRSGDFPLICEDVRKDYGDHCVFKDVNLSIRRGEKVAFVGRNGEGKSTLVKCIMGEIPFEGNLKVGHNVQIGYFAQNQAQLLDGELTVHDTIDRVARGEIRLKINNILGAFMFGGEEADKKVKVLSGGERSRLAMIRLLLEPVNFLILDEPTNHLDMVSKDVLKEAIKAFDGTAIIVSHDRQFLDGLVSKVYEFGNQKVIENIGGIYDFLAKKNIENLDLLGTPAGANANSNSGQGGGTKGSGTGGSSGGGKQSLNGGKPGSGNSGKQGSGSSQQGAPAGTNPSDGSSAKMSYEERKKLQRQKAKIEKDVKASEKRIAEYEAKLKELDALLSNPENAANMELVNEYTTVKSALDVETEHYFELCEQFEIMG